MDRAGHCGRFHLSFGSHRARAASLTPQSSPTPEGIPSTVDSRGGPPRLSWDEGELMGSSSDTPETRAPAQTNPAATDSNADWRTRLRDAALPVHLISLPISFAILLYVDRGLWFFYDEWDFLAGQGTGGRPLNLFVPHNEHWSTIPILMYRALYAAVGLHTYIPYLVVMLLAHVILAHLLFRVMIRIDVDPWIATALATVFLFLGAGAENLTWAFQMAWIISLLLGVAGLLLIDHERAGRRRDLAYWPVAVLALMCSGVGVPLVAVGGLVALIRRGWRAALRVVSLPAIVFVVWFALVGHVGYTTTHPAKSVLLQVSQYAWTGLTSAVSSTLGWQGAGAIVVLALAVFLAAQGPKRWRRRAIPLSMAVGAVLFFGITGIGRIAFGVNEFDVRALCLCRHRPVAAGRGMGDRRAGSPRAWWGRLRRRPRSHRDPKRIRRAHRLRRRVGFPPRHGQISAACRCAPHCRWGAAPRQQCDPTRPRYRSAVESRRAPLDDSRRLLTPRHAGTT